MKKIKIKARTLSLHSKQIDVTIAYLAFDTQQHHEWVSISDNHKTKLFPCLSILKVFVKHKIIQNAI